MSTPTGPESLPCPVCGRPSGDAGPGPCLTCGLPAVGQAALVVARIGVTLTELNRDRDHLLAALRAAAPGTPAPPPPPVHPIPRAAAPPVQPPMPPPPMPPPPMPPPPVQPPPGPRPWSPFLPESPAPRPARPPRARLSPQQVLVGLGAVLVVAAAITFVAVAWTRLGVVFQSAVMLVVTGMLCGASAWVARRLLRATEEALAATGAALLIVDLVAARSLGLFRIEDISLRLWWAISCAIVVVVALVLGRLTRTTATWPLVALFAAQPIAFLLLTGELLTGPVGVAVALCVATGDAVAAQRLRPVLVPMATVLAATSGAAGILGGIATAAGDDPGDSWAATAILAVAGAGALLVVLRPAAPAMRFPELVPAAVGAIVGISLALSAETAGDVGPLIAAGVGVLLLVGAVLTAGRIEPTALLTAAGATLALVPAAQLADELRLAELAAVALALTLPAALAAVRLTVLRPHATAAAFLAPTAAVLLARADGVLSVAVAGLLLALLGAFAFGLATLRADRPEEWAAAGAGTVAGLAAGVSTSTIGAWGQVALQLAIVGAAAAIYSVVAGRREVGILAVTDLVIASWIAVRGAQVDTPEAYTLTAAAGLALIALPALRAGARSWAGEGAAVAVALVPSALVVIAQPTALRLVLVVAAAAVATVVGTVLHRQAPFVIGAGVLLAVVVGRLAPYTPLLPRWVTLGTAGLLLLVVGATYERRRQQAREAVAWVAQMR